MRLQRERNEQIRFVTWFKWQYPEYQYLIAHFANGGYRHPKEAVYFKRLGVLSGMPDLGIFVPKGPYHGLFIEMKPPLDEKGRKQGSLSLKQKYVGERLKEQGYEVVVANGCDEAEVIWKKYNAEN